MLNWEQDDLQKWFRDCTDEEIIQEYQLFRKLNNYILDTDTDRGFLLTDIIFEGFSSVCEEISSRYVNERKARTDAEASPSAGTPLVPEGKEAR